MTHVASTDPIEMESPTIGRSNALRVAVAAAAAAASGFVVLMIAARVLVPVANNTVFVTFWSALFACFGVLSGISIETTRASTASIAGSRGTSSTAGERRPRLLVVGVTIGVVAGGVIGVAIPLWAPMLFGTHEVVLGVLIAVGVAGYSVHSVVVGTLAGTGRWRPYSWLIGAESVARLLLIIVAAVLGARLVGFAAGAAIAAFTWVVFYLCSPAVRSTGSVRADSALGTFLRRLGSAAVATGASALLVVGFPMLLSLSTPAAEWASAAPLVLAITLTRAPLMIPLNAYQGVAVTHFVKNSHLGLRAMVPACRAVVAVGAVGALLAYLVGPWLMRTILGPDYRVSGAVLGALMLAAILLALLTLSGALCQALTLHAGFVGGWVVAVLVAVATLQLPVSIEVRAVAALALGPVVGIVVHLIALRKHVAPGSSESPVSEPVATSGREGVRVSVCMATYNGEKYIEEQLESIVAQLGPQDEVVIVDDASTDGTVARVRSFDDPRVLIFESVTNRGYVRTFEDALGRARGEFILLADQDDVWVDGRLTAMVAALSETAIVATNLRTLGGPDSIHGPYGQADWHLRSRDSGRRVANIVGMLAGSRPYYGCAMALRRTALETVLPMPSFLNESHDLWIAMYGNLTRSITHLEVRTVNRRYHSDNASPDRPRGLRSVLRSRLLLIQMMRELRRRRMQKN